MASGTAPNTSVILTAKEIEFINRRYGGSKSQAIHQGLAAIMPIKNNAHYMVNPAAEPFITMLRPLVQHRYDLDGMQQAINALRVEQMVDELRRHGIAARCRFKIPVAAGGGEYQTNYVLIYAPEGVDEPNEWATVEECRRLLDTVANLEPDEAFRRWRERIEPFDNTYTRQDAERDMRAERVMLRQQYETGQLDGEMYRIAFSQSRDFLNYVTPEQPGDMVAVSAV